MQSSLIFLIVLPVLLSGLLVMSEIGSIAMLLFSCLKVNMFMFVRNGGIWMSAPHKRMWIFFATTYAGFTWCTK